MHYVGRPRGVNEKRQRDVVDAIQRMNRLHDQTVSDPEIATRIGQYEMAFRMQTSVPDLVDFKDEPQHILDLYGTKGSDGSFAANCLLARRPGFCRSRLPRPSLPRSPRRRASRPRR